MNALTFFEYRLQDALEAFEEALDYQGLQYTAHALYGWGFRDDADILRAINRAILVFKCADIDPKKHFRYYYAVDMDRHRTTREWRISKLGFYLVLCNAEPGNPYAGAFQLALCRRMMDEPG